LFALPLIHREEAAAALLHQITNSSSRSPAVSVAQLQGQVETPPTKLVLWLLLPEEGVEWKRVRTLMNT